jgi:ATPase subunit of ABC transporter with duplicated ATPase domains
MVKCPVNSIHCFKGLPRAFHRKHHHAVRRQAVVREHLRQFGDGNRYGLIGANGCGKSTFMKILGGDLEPSAGNVMLDVNERLGKLRQDQFAYEEMRVLDVVMMGHTEMWAAMADATRSTPIRKPPTTTT